MPVRCLADFNEDEKNHFLQFYSTIPMPHERYNQYGLRFDMEVLTGLGASIVFFPIESMTEFVDARTRVAVDKNDSNLTTQILSTTVIEMLRMPINCTSVGNLAYVACYHQSAIVRLKAVQFLEGIYNMQLNKS